MSDLINKPPKDEPNFALSKGKLTSKTSTFRQRINDVNKQREAVDPQTMPNRICLMLDCSGSMDSKEDSNRGSVRRIDLLKDAVQNFVSRCNFTDTSVAIAAFPGRSDKAIPLTTQSATIIDYSVGLKPTGATPLYTCLVMSIEEMSMTRGVVVSDGGATDWTEIDTDQALESTKGKILQIYKEQGIPLDCVHISSSQDGEDLLRRIASETGGIFLKFSDVNAFSKAFGYLTPGYRAMLTSGSVDAKQIGAEEIK